MEGEEGEAKIIDYDDCWVGKQKRKIGEDSCLQKPAMMAMEHRGFYFAMAG
jgi:hypothetical protein